MKILIAYDGSECAGSALVELKSAGLPKTAEAIVMSLADVFLPPPTDEEADDTFPVNVSAGVAQARKRAERELKKADLMARGAAKQIKESFPGWQVRHEALADSPAWALIRKSEEWAADLIVIGAQGHSVLGGRLVLGSVSQRVLYEARCSVRIARGRTTDGATPLRIVIAVDNSTYSNAAVDAVCQREWPRETEVRLLTVVDTVMPVAPDPTSPLSMKWVEVDDEDKWDPVSYTHL